MIRNTQAEAREEVFFKEAIKKKDPNFKKCFIQPLRHPNNVKD